MIYTEQLHVETHQCPFSPHIHLFNYSQPRGSASLPGGLSVQEDVCLDSYRFEISAFLAETQKQARHSVFLLYLRK